MNTDVSTTAPAMCEADSIAFDLQCTNCGYNLRGLQQHGICPECASPIEQSLHERRLIHTPTEWLRSLQRGAAMMLWCFALAILMCIGAIVSLFVDFEPTLASLLNPLASLLFVVSVFFLTKQEPQTSKSAQREKLRYVVRGSAVAAFAGEAVLLTTGGFGNGILEATGTVLCVGYAVAAVGTLILLRHLAHRIPDNALTKSTSTIIRRSIVAASLLTMCWIIKLLAGHIGTWGTTYDDIVTLLSGVGSFVLLTAILMYANAMKLYYKAFKSAAVHSASNPTAS